MSSNDNRIAECVAKNTMSLWICNERVSALTKQTTESQTGVNFFGPCCSNACFASCVLQNETQAHVERVGRMISSTYSPSLSLQVLFLNVGIANV